jgi:hypothetical protein
MTERINVSLRLDRDIWKEARKKAIDLDLTIGKFVETAILHEMKKVNGSTRP